MFELGHFTHCKFIKVVFCTVDVFCFLIYLFKLKCVSFKRLLSFLTNPVNCLYKPINCNLLMTINENMLQNKHTYPNSGDE